MSMHLGYCQPPSQALKSYAASLYARRNEGIVAPRKRIIVGEWAPAANLCHANATELAEKDKNYSAIRGWLYFAIGECSPFVRFAAHSVVQMNDGQLIDITPTDPIVSLYPFIRANLSEDDYADAVYALEDKYQSSNCLDHWLS